jgi:hypothetical protein
MIANLKKVQFRGSHVLKANEDYGEVMAGELF